MDALLTEGEKKSLLERARLENPVRRGGMVEIETIEKCEERDLDPPIRAVVKIRYEHKLLEGDCFACGGQGYLSEGTCGPCSGRGKRPVIAEGMIAGALYGVAEDGTFELWAN
jgi:hypothetical protein